MFADLGIRVLCICVLKQLFQEQYGAGKLLKQLMTFLCDLLRCNDKRCSTVLENKLDSVVRIIWCRHSKCTSGLQNTLSYRIKITAAFKYNTYDFFPSHTFFNESIGNSVCPLIQLGICEALFT